MFNLKPTEMNKLLIFLGLLISTVAMAQRPDVTEVAYIETTTDMETVPYINTGYVYTASTRVVMKCKITDGGANSVLFGTREKAQAGAFAFSYRKGNSITGMLECNTAVASGNIELPVGKIVRIEAEGNTANIYMGDESVPYSTIVCDEAIADGTTPIYIFNLHHYCSVYTSPTYMRLYSFQIYEGEELVKDYVPVVTSDGDTGLLEKNSGDLLFSPNSAPFVYGTNDSDELKEVAYIESVYTNPTVGAYINTGYKPKSTTKVVMECNISNQHSSPNENISLFGARTSATEKSFVLHAFISGNSNNRQWNGRYDFAKYNSPEVIGDKAIECGKKYKVVADNTGAYFYAETEGGYSSSPSVVLDNSAKKDIDFAADYPMYIFALDEKNTVKDGSRPWYAYMKLYSFQIYENGEMVKDYVPVAAEDGKGGLKDRLTGETLFSSNSTPFVTPSDTSPVEEPMETSPVRYIESTFDMDPAPYINTGYIHKSNTRIELECDINELGTPKGQPSVLFGARTAAYNQAFNFFSYMDDASVLWKGTFDCPRRGVGTVDIPRGEKIRIVASKDGAYVYNDASESPYATIPAAGTMTDGAYPMYIFDLDNAGMRRDWPSFMKLYRFKVYEGDVLVRDYVPVVVKKNNGKPVGGLKDLVSGDVLTSANGTPFKYEKRYELSLTNGFCTFSDAYPYVVETEDVAAYFATELSGDKVILSQTDNIPANTGVILYGKEKESVTLRIADALPEESETNMLRPNVEPSVLTATSGGYANYMLAADSDEEGKIIFRQPVGEERLAGNRAYLALPVESGDKVKYYIGFEGEPTGILDEGLRMKDGSNNPSSLISHPSSIYDLQGRKISSSSGNTSNSWYHPSSKPGVYISEGKKIVIK